MLPVHWIAQRGHSDSIHSQSTSSDPDTAYHDAVENFEGGAKQSSDGNAPPTSPTHSSHVSISSPEEVMEQLLHHHLERLRVDCEQDEGEAYYRDSHQLTREGAESGDGELKAAPVVGEAVPGDSEGVQGESAPEESELAKNEQPVKSEESGENAEGKSEQDQGKSDSTHQKTDSEEPKTKPPAQGM